MPRKCPACGKTCAQVVGRWATSKRYAGSRRDCAVHEVEVEKTCQNCRETK